MKGSAFTFSARLERVEGGGPFYVTIPASVSRAIGRRGIVPVVAVANGVAEVRASMTPCGGGRHRLRLNAEARDRANVRVGSRVAFELRVDESPVVDPAPADLARALRDEGLFDTWSGFPAGKQNHIIQWIEKSAKEATREKRIASTIEWTLQARERQADRAAKRRART